MLKKFALSLAAVALLIPCLTQAQNADSNSPWVEETRQLLTNLTQHFKGTAISEVTIRECTSGTSRHKSSKGTSYGECKFCVSPGPDRSALEICMSGLSRTKAMKYYPEEGVIHLNYPGPELKVRCGGSRDCDVARDWVRKNLKTYVRDVDLTIRALTIEAGISDEKILDAGSMLTRMQFRHLMNTFREDELVLRAREVYPASTQEEDNLTDAAREKLTAVLSVPNWGVCDLHLSLGSAFDMYCRSPVDAFK